MIQKIDDTYFIVDCWNHRVLYNTSIEKDLKKWQTLTDESYVGGHTIASDGELYVLDNTDRKIQEAQARLCEDSDNCILISELAKTFVENGKMKDSYHYTQDGYNLLGEDAGKKAAEYSNEICK